MLLWCGGVVQRVSDGTWIIPTISGRGRKMYAAGEAVEVYWDAIPDANFPAGSTIEKIDPKKWNKSGVGAWRMDLEDLKL